MEQEYIEYDVSQFGGQWLGFVHEIGLWARSTGRTTIMRGTDSVRVYLRSGENKEAVEREIDEVVLSRKIKLAMKMEKKLKK